MTYTENHKMLLEKIRELNKWRHILFSWIGRLSIVKMTIFFKFVCSFGTISRKNSSNHLANIDKLILKFIWKHKGFKIANTILKKNKSREPIFPDFKL